MNKMINYTSQLLSKPQDEVNRKILEMPALILDQKDKINELVEDPLAVEREGVMINHWTLEERNIFSKKLAAFEKDFQKITSFLDHKTTADCVELYYKDHKTNCLQKDKKMMGCKSRKSKTSTSTMKGLGNHKANVDSQKKLIKTPAMVCGAAVNQRTRSRRLHLWRKYDESERVAVDALIDMCDFLSPEATKHEEKAAFLQAVSSFGKDLRMILRHVGTKSKDWCKKFFIKGQKSHRLDLMRHRLENIGSLLNEIDIGMSTYTNDAHIVEGDSAADNDKLDTKTNDDQPSSAANSSRDKSKPMEARNLSTNFKESVIGNDKSGTKTNDEQSSSGTNLSHDKSKPVEARNRSADFNESREINREFDHQDKTIISNT
ncbi:Nuclear receptor corepressor 1 [Glycine soja]